jgi:hypothetical protein
VAGGPPCRWVAGDEPYGGDPNLALALRGHRLGYVLDGEDPDRRCWLRSGR